MKKNRMNKILKAILICLVILVGFQLGTNANHIKTSLTGAKETSVKNETKKVALMDLNKDYCDAKCILDKNDKAVTFLTKAFGVNKDIVVTSLMETNKESAVNELNIGKLTDANGNLIEFNSFDRGLIEYLYKFASANPGLVDNTHIGYTGSREYVENLIKYFTKLYPEVDYLTVISIGAAESGYYTASGMLYVNNVYGGMGSGGLISYKNIEYGILSYVKYLADNYYAMGLTTVESIGYKYCPSINENGNKVTSPHWLNLVSRAKGVYANTSNDVTIDILVD